MRVRNVNSWQEVKEALRAIESEWCELAKQAEYAREKPSFLYRGQGNSEWRLETTLERVVKPPVAVSQYYLHVLKTHAQVEAFSNTKWELMGLDEYTKWTASISDLNWSEFPGYEYMIYVRHHGFPSPLLDWTRSPYVAAYFAYSNIPKDSNSVCIYCYSDSFRGGKFWVGGEPTITVKGPYARSHKRHFLQQCQYTLCSKTVDKELRYVCHEEVFDKDDKEQDLLWKIVAPATSVSEALKDLDLMNINAFSLMGTEDSLLQTLAVRQYLM